MTISKNPPSSVKRIIIDIDKRMSEALRVVSAHEYAAYTDALMHKKNCHIFWTERFFADAVLLIVSTDTIRDIDKQTCLKMMTEYIQDEKRAKARRYQRARYGGAK